MDSQLLVRASKVTTHKIIALVIRVFGITEVQLNLKSREIRFVFARKYYFLLTDYFLNDSILKSKVAAKINLDRTMRNHHLRSIRDLMQNEKVYEKMFDNMVADLQGISKPHPETYPELLNETEWYKSKWVRMQRGEDVRKTNRRAGVRKEDNKEIDDANDFYNEHQNHSINNNGYSYIQHSYKSE